MNVRHDHIAVYTFVVFLFSFSLFCYGFFPLSFSPSTKASFDELPQTIGNASFNGTDYKPRISRAILMVIDALRMDFVVQEENFQFLNQLLSDGKACLYRLQVHPPTVTMPRIKAMTSGAIPSFLDVILNLGSPEMQLDTFLYQMKQRQQKTVFYGDNTWTNMFPNTFHRRGENTDSLYVNDFYKGDQNITKLLNMELQMYDWKLMILHYLGLDHIGHVEGPYSDKVPGKLQEMDTVIKTIHQTMDKWKQKYYTKPLLIITGDHGMRDSGGHGGSTHPETIVPVVIVSDQCAKSEDTFLQIDLAPSMSILMGVAIPYASIGSMIDPALKMLHRRDMLYALYYNTQRLASKVEAILRDTFQQTEVHKSYEEAKNLHQLFLQDTTDVSAYKRALLLYTSVSKNLTQLLISSYIRYDIVFILVGTIMALLCAAIAITQLLQHDTTATALPLHPKLFPSINCVLLSFLLLKLLSFEKESVQEATHTFHAVIVLLSVVYFTLWVILTHLLKGVKAPAVMWFLDGTSFLSPFIWCGVGFHCISLASSSFVEEEHQTWYYFTSSVMVLLTLKQLNVMNSTIGVIKHTKTDPSLVEVCKEERSIFCVASIAFVCIHVLVRRFNQTGDKWQHIPDVGDWLSKDEHKVWLSITMFVGLCYLVYQICYMAGLLTTVLSMTASMLIYYYRAASGTVSIFGLSASNSSICLTIFWINLVEIFFIGFLPMMYRAIVTRTTPTRSSELYSNCIIMVALLSALLHKPHNVLLVGTLFATSRFLTERIDRIADDKYCSVMLKVITHYWLGKTFYFYQGNSNSLATIDLNAGYVGLNKFDIIRVGLFLTLHTFSAPILSFLLLLHHIFLDNERDVRQQHRSETRNNIRERILTLLNVLITVPVSFFLAVATILRDHIFVWTVFSPKIIYEYFTVWLVLIQVILVISLLPKPMSSGV
ncbi:GPI ethanolamine phosphate transferase 2 [Anopheles marshallii]|uniref:GPI ethanolamine phosphate transferase 2 n=1 Tax=Anopheles marshallii TaxID=1521116 RepID=UPI00237B17B1|nr:GPI ethanolamine phosphate transferase 2 [Anopheles marshallii]